MAISKRGAKSSTKSTKGKGVSRPKGTTGNPTSKKGLGSN